MIPIDPTPVIPTCDTVTISICVTTTTHHGRSGLFITTPHSDVWTPIDRCPVNPAASCVIPTKDNTGWFVITPPGNPAADWQLGS